MSQTLLVHCTYGKEDAERAILPFIVGNVAVTADQQATIFLTIEGVRLATKGYAEQVNKEGFPPLKEIMNSLENKKEKKANIFGAAFGPGLTMETFILSDD